MLVQGITALCQERLVSPVDKTIDIDASLKNVTLREVGTFNDKTTMSYVADNSILVEILETKMGGPVVLLRNLHSGKTRALYKYGSGRKQLLAVQPHLDGNKLLLNDFIKKEVYIVDINKALRRKHYCPRSTKVKVETQYMIPGRGKSIMILNPASFDSGVARSVTVKRPYVYKQKDSEAMHAFNVMHGILLRNAMNEGYCYIDQHEGLLEFWETGEKLVTRIHVETPYKAEYREINNGSLIFRGGIPFSFLAGAANKERIALLFDPHKMVRGERTGYKRPLVLFFDWEGNSCGTLEVSGDVRPNAISLSDDGRLTLMACEGEVLHVFECTM